MMKPSKALGVAAIVSIAVAFLFFASAAAPAMSSNQASAFISTQANLLPNPVLNSNVTWTTFNSSWQELEYNNGTGLRNLSGTPNPFFQNPITINTSDIVSQELHNPLYSKTYWNNTTEWSENAGGKGFPTNGATTSISESVTNGENTITITGNSSKSGSSGAIGYHMNIPTSDLPSTNYAYDYLTLSGYNQVNDNVAGYSYQIGIFNSSNYGTFLNATNGTITTKGTYLQANTPFYLSFPIIVMGKENLTQTSEITIIIRQQWTSAVSTNDIGTITITGMALSESPLYIGSSTENREINGVIGNAHLISFSPAPLLSQTKVKDNGYTVAVSQPLQNVTTSQNAISDGNYIEQVEYQGSFELPTAPDLTYGPANISEQFNVSTSQTQVLDINGVSYLSAISGKNGTITLSSVNPNSQTQFLQIVDYTQSQWNSISSPPGIFSIAGIEYYWWIAVGGLATLIGLAGAAKHAGTKADQERIRRGGGGR